MIAATVFGRPLPAGGTIGVAAPASGFENRSEVLRGVEWWEERGYRVNLASTSSTATITWPATSATAPPT